MIIEMRTYRTKPGRRTEFIALFRSRSIPAHRALGMAISEPLLSVEDADTFFFMRGFPDLASREPLKAKFYESTLWKEELEGVLMPMLDEYTVVVVEGPEELFRASATDRRTDAKRNELTKQQNGGHGAR